MSAALPLPLELTQPMKLASSLEDSLKAPFQVETTKYNPEKQVRETPEGVPMILNGGGTSSVQQSQSVAVLIAVDALNDIVQIDDILNIG